MDWCVCREVFLRVHALETQENNETMMKEAVGLREEAGEGGCGSWSDSRQVRCVHHEVAVRVYS